jgi:hypothetical protein
MEDGELKNFVQANFSGKQEKVLIKSEDGKISCIHE